MITKEKLLDAIEEQGAYVSEVFKSVAGREMVIVDGPLDLEKLVARLNEATALNEEDK
jgi:hypothetical protein